MLHSSSLLTVESVSIDTTTTTTTTKVHPLPKGTRTGATFNLANCAVGAGVLGLPFAIASAGLALGWILLIFLSLIAWLGLRFIVYAATATRANSYEDLVARVAGDRAATAFKLLIVAYSMGVAVGYIVIVGDLMPKVVGHWIDGDAGDDEASRSFWASRAVWQTLPTFAVMLPLSSLRSIDSLRHASMLAIAAIMSLSSPSSSAPRTKHVTWFSFTPDIFVATPIIAFALGGHLQSVAIFKDLAPQKQSLANWNLIAMYVVVGLSSLYAAVASFAYMQHGAEVEANVLLSFASSDVLVQISAIAISVVVTLSYPLFVWSLRNSLDMLLFPDARPAPFARLLALSIGIVASTYTIAILFPDIKFILSFLGSTGAVLIKFVVPSYLYLRTAPPDDSRMRIGAWAVLIVGVVVGLVSTTVVLVGAAS
ncbi:amino acid transporter [Thecamonas trahens ATCC 50062]|uniref:Amino acid transporter n=1 Tax=Thecamonas trahens ATCC 50062 TaxID=461836 RepID=A0A0L0DTR4_THETB|nr:amino acid transporter [Thecamonas trahens ATCC 50062]KNC55724.1 amino acid transporter [Thecamonas trahens ATCC 50062]|eukprot:XP_013752932.1 amino acid transporter [Thecamonas trahens ATCC 50062]